MIYIIVIGAVIGLAAGGFYLLREIDKQINK